MERPSGIRTGRIEIGSNTMPSRSDARRHTLSPPVTSPTSKTKAKWLAAIRSEHTVGISLISGDLRDSLHHIEKYSCSQRSFLFRRYEE